MLPARRGLAAPAGDRQPRPRPAPVALLRLADRTRIAARRVEGVRPLGLPDPPAVRSRRLDRPPADANAGEPSRGRADGPRPAKPSPLSLIGLALFSTPFQPAPARGDGGTLRAWEQRGDYDIAVFTEPSPLVTGPVDISVLLLDRRTGGPIPGARIEVEVSPLGRPGQATRQPANTRQARDQQASLHAALFELSPPPADPR